MTTCGGFIGLTISVGCGSKVIMAFSLSVHWCIIPEASPKAITSPVGDTSKDEQYPFNGTYNN